VVLAEDEVLLREGLASLLERAGLLDELMAEGRSNAGIAHQVWVTEGTVRADRSRLIASL
jgi:serine/threonine-protein kinase PknK